MANFQPDLNIEYDGKLLNGTDLLYDTTQGVRIWGNATQDNYSIGDTTTGGVDSTYGTNNLALGAYALNAINSGKTYNIAIGTNSLKALTTGDYNIAIGSNSGTALLSGYNNVILGKDTFKANTSGYDNIIIGYNTTAANTGVSSSSVVIGSRTLPIFNSPDIVDSVVIGSKTFPALTTNNLFDSVIIGSNNFPNLVNWDPSNVAGTVVLGTSNFYSTTTLGYGNIFLGSSLTPGPVIGDRNVYLGGIVPGNVYSNGINTGPDDNVVIGYEAGVYSPYNATSVVLIGTGANAGSYSTLVGAGAAQAGTTGQYNTLIGSYVTQNLTTGSNNIILGYGAAGNLTTGSNNIFIGQNILAQTATGSNNIDILTNSGTTGIQYTNSTGILSLKSGKTNVEGRLVVGTTTSNTSANIYISNPITGGTSAYAIRSIAEVQTDVTSGAYHSYSSPSIVSGHPGLNTLAHFSAYPGNFNSAIVTNQYGFIASSGLAEAVSNTGFYGNISGNSKTINTMSQSGTTVTAVTSIAHTLKVGSVISVYGCSDPLFDISRAVVTGISTTVVANDTITFTSPLTRTVGSTSVSGTLYDLSDLNLEMYGTAPNVINGYLLVGRSLAYLDSMQITQTPGSTQIVANNQFTGGISSTNNSTNLTYGSSISLLKNYSATVTDMTAAPTNMNIGHIYWGTTDGRKYINAASILVRTTAATNLADTAGGGATTNMIFNVANNAMPSEVGRFTPLGLQVLATQINTGTKANTAWLASGTADSTTFLRGDGTWATTSGAASTQSIARTFALMGA